MKTIYIWDLEGRCWFHVARGQRGRCPSRFQVGWAKGVKWEAGSRRRGMNEWKLGQSEWFIVRREGERLTGAG
jgi:hypothetical protein